MGKKEKLIARLKSKPRDFTFEEAETLLGFLGYSKSDKGKTSGSRVMFVNSERDLKLIMHKPHPSNIIKGYVMRDILNYLLKNNYIK